MTTPTGQRRLGDRYELGDVLGRGGMAEVHLGRDVRLGRSVAVKTLRTDLARDPTFQARFRREAQSAASLNHPAVVAVYDTGEDNVNGVALPYIVMEYVDGSTLRELLQSGRKLLPERALEITAGICRALDYSHRQGIVHRDIKPANVMLTRGGEVKVMDFGIARAVADTAATMTATSAVIGTAQYLSPEQARGERADARSDIYATGCLLYELLTGRPPFVGDSPGLRGVPARPRGSRTAVAARPRDPAGVRRHRAQGAGKEPREPLPDRRRDARGHRPRAVGPAGDGDSPAGSGSDERRYGDAAHRAGRLDVGDGAAHGHDAAIPRCAPRAAAFPDVGVGAARARRPRRVRVGTVARPVVLRRQRAAGPGAADRRANRRRRRARCSPMPTWFPARQPRRRATRSPRG